MNNNFDLVVIYRRMEKKDVINYIPVYCEVGTYNQESEVFTTTKGKKYHHMIEGEEYAFLGRLPLSRYTDLYPKSSLFTIKTKAFINNAKHRYILSESEDNVPIVLQVEKNNECNIFLDRDLISFYNKYYPELEIDNIIGNNEMNISDVYKELTSKIIGQDEQIKQILSTIWKQYNNEDKTFNYNMLINGPEGVGKTTIFKLLEELLGIPCVIINAKRLGNEGYIENILLNLLEKTEFDVEKAKTGILVIDKLEEISEEVINMIARIAYDRKLGAKSINEILESSLALAEFEIASNSSLYESLIIDKSTIKDNKKYILVKRKNN